MVSDLQETQNTEMQRDENTASVATNATEKSIASAKKVSNHSDKKEFATKGARIHNEVTYRLVDWLLNSAVGVSFTYWTERRESGQKYFGKPISDFFNKRLKPFLKTEESLKSGSKWGSMFVSIMAGGTAIIPLMVTLENKKNKKSIIKWMDEKLYGKERVENDPTFQEAYDAIDEEPKKNFTTGMIARFAALAPLLAITVSPANKWIEKNFYSRIGDATRWCSEKVGIKPKKLMDEATRDAKGNTDWQFIHKTIGFDFGLTFIYAYLHEWAYKALSAFGFKKNEEKEVSSQVHEDKAFLKSAGIRPDDADDIAKLNTTSQNGKKAFSETIKPRNTNVSAKSFAEMAERNSEAQATVGA